MCPFSHFNPSAIVASVETPGPAEHADTAPARKRFRTGQRALYCRDDALLGWFAGEEIITLVTADVCKVSHGSTIGTEVISGSPLQTLP
jgi:hypothetical protein